MMLLYSLALFLSLVVAAPWWLYRMLTTERYREGLLQRLGRVPSSLCAYVAGKRTVWVHAVSVGEVLAASSLIAQLELELGSECRIVISTTTRAGQQLACKRFAPERVFYFPLDFRFAVRRWLRALLPELLLLTESELWPRLLYECARCDIPVAVVNARVSDRSFRRSLRFAAVWRWMTQHVTLWLAQSDEDSDRLLRLGAPADKVHATGNLKYDTPTPRESPLLAAIRAGATNRPIIVAGSTVEYGTTPEEGIVLDALQDHVWPEHPDVLLVLAPRHPQRFTEAKVLAAQFGTTVCATELLGPMQSGSQPALIEERILVLDTIGDLAALYSLASAAFVGGSLLPHGGHNPLEPAQFGVPVVMGPHVENFRDIVGRLQAVEGIVLLDSTEPGPLGEALAGLLADPLRAHAIGKSGHFVCQQQKGATVRTVAALLPLFNPESSGAPLRAELHPAVSGLAPLAHSSTQSAPQTSPSEPGQEAIP